MHVQTKKFTVQSLFLMLLPFTGGSLIYFSSYFTLIYAIEMKGRQTCLNQFFSPCQSFNRR